MDFPILSVAIRYEQDVVLVRRRARQIATLIGFEEQDGTRIATAASEIGRNAFSYANGGKAEFLVEGGSGKQVLVVRISDEGPGIRNTEEILSGQYQSQTGMGLGIVGARRLMDGFELKSSPGRGTVVTLKKNFPPAAPQFNVASLAGLTDHLTQAPQDFLEEVRLHNHELLEALDSLQERQEELSRLNKELEETNRGVVALYAELDEKAEHLRRADQLKSRFLSHMSHEFRTPLNAIIGLTRLLIKRDDIAKSPDASRQITYIQKSAQELTELVNDLLDLAKVEAGKLTIHTVEFDASELLRGLRGILRPLLTHDNIDLTFDEVSLPTMKSDEGKIAQILRNFVSNALKFTEQGEVRVSAVYESELDSVVFSVRDTGIGIAPEHLGRIFEEFSQIDSPTQQRVKGTGLGLPLCKKLAELLGGSIRVESKVGQGSTFSAVIPRVLGVFAP
jgi:signal transduction histidine kinase